MRCSALPTTCSVDSTDAGRIGATFEAMLVQQIITPLTKSCDVLGDYGSTELATAIARRDAGGFGALLAQQLELGHEHR